MPASYAPRRQEPNCGCASATSLLLDIQYNQKFHLLYSGWRPGLKVSKRNMGNRDASRVEPDVRQHVVPAGRVLLQFGQQFVFSTGAYKPEFTDLPWPIHVQRARAIGSRVITIAKVRGANVQCAEAVQRPRSQSSEVPIRRWSNPDPPAVATAVLQSMGLRPNP